jgi:glycerophosphoryl diester phosphodiesterase
MWPKLRRILITIILLLIAVLSLVRLTSRRAAPMPYLQTLPARPVVLAHQCGDNVWPGDTLYACERAVDMGADVLDLDFQMTADNVPVLIHDETLERTSNGAGQVADYTLAELKKLDAAYRWSPDGGQTFPYRGRGITFTAVEEIFQAFPAMHVNIEIKTETAAAGQALCALIRQYRMEDNVMAASFADVQMHAFRRACPEVATAATQNEMIVFFGLQAVGLGSLYSPSFQTVQIPEERFGIQLLTSGFIASAHERGLELHVWTINETSDMERILTLGVDGINTDRPDRLLDVLERPYALRP